MMDGRADARTHAPRTAQADREGVEHLNVQDATVGKYTERAVARTAQAQRGVLAYQDWTSVPPSERPLAVARMEVAGAFDRVMHAHWVAGEGAFSNCAVARACGVDERIVRRWRLGEQPIPIAALLVMPPTLAAEIVSLVQDRRVLSPHQRGVPALLDAVAALAEPARAEDVADLRRALREAERAIQARRDRLDEEGR